MSDKNDAPRPVERSLRLEDRGGESGINLGGHPPARLQEGHMQAAGATPEKPPTKPPQASADSGKSATPPKAAEK